MNTKNLILKKLSEQRIEVLEQCKSMKSSTSKDAEDWLSYLILGQPNDVVLNEIKSFCKDFEINVIDEIVEYQIETISICMLEISINNLINKQ